ncbi:MAG: hypothetical protein ACLS6G_06955 [Christensenellales bacterium]
MDRLTTKPEQPLLPGSGSTVPKGTTCVPVVPSSATSSRCTIAPRYGSCATHRCGLPSFSKEKIAISKPSRGISSACMVSSMLRISASAAS